MITGSAPILAFVEAMGSSREKVMSSPRRIGRKGGTMPRLSMPMFMPQKNDPLLIA